MSSGMNVEQAKEYAKTMTYKQAVYNCFHAKGIMFRKATLIKLHELAEIADRLDKSSESQTDWEKEKSEKSLCNSCEKDCDNRKRNLYTVECNRYEPQTDCGWR